MDWALLPLRRYANFSGRARRLEHWMFVLTLALGVVIVTVCDAIFILEWGHPRAGGILASIFVLAALVPLLAMSVRRLHDTGRSGWWAAVPMAGLLLGAVATEMDAALISLPLLAVGIIGSIVALVFHCLPGTKGPNAYGPDPKYSPDLDDALNT